MTALTSTIAALDSVLLDYLSLKDRRIGADLLQIRDVIDGWQSAKSDAEARNEKFGGFFNPLKLVPLKETIHSRIIGELLNPQGSHGQSSLFLQRFLQRIGLPTPSVGEWRLTVEEDRVDLILARSKPQSVILIENKANDAQDQPNQLYRYWHRQIYRRLPTLDYEDPETRGSFRVIYLSSDGKKMPEPHSLERPQGWEGINPSPTLPLACESFGLGELMRLLEEEARLRAPTTNARLKTFLEMYSELWNL